MKIFYKSILILCLIINSYLQWDLSKEIIAENKNTFLYGASFFKINNILGNNTYIPYNSGYKLYCIQKYSNDYNFIGLSKIYLFNTDIKYLVNKEGFMVIEEDCNEVVVGINEKQYFQVIINLISTILCVVFLLKI